MNKLSFFALLLTCCLLSPKVDGMEKDSVSTLHLSKCVLFYSHAHLTNQWTMGPNSAGLMFHKMDRISRGNASLGQTNQNIRRAMDAGQIRSVKVHTESLQTLGKVKVQGLFGYQNQGYEELKYNGTMDFRHMNLYMVGDTIGGKQRQEGYFFNAQVAYPFFKDRLFVGIQMDYEASVGAKIRDLRNRNTIVRAKFTPALIYNHKNLSVGISGGTTTETNFSEVKSYLDDRHTLFYHMGMGHYSASGNFSGTETILYEGSGNHGGLQLQYRKKNWSSFHTFDYSMLTTEARIGNTYRLINGITDYESFSYKGFLLIEKPGSLHHFKVNARASTANATEVRQESYSQWSDGLYLTLVRNIRWIEDKNIVDDYSGGMEYQYIKKGAKRPFRYQITAVAQAGMHDATHYPSELYGFYNATSVTGHLEYQHFLQWKRINIDPSIGAGSRFILQSDAVFKPFPNYLAKVPQLDYRFFSEDYYVANLGVNLSTSRIPLQRFSQVFLDINSTYMIFPNVDIKDNFNFSLLFSLGVVF